MTARLSRPARAALAQAVSDPVAAAQGGPAPSRARHIARVDLIEGMAKGMAVLESFGTERQRLNTTLAAQRAGLSRAAARRHLLTLAHLGYLESDGGHFWLSHKVLRLSGAYLSSARLPRLLQPTLNRLAQQSRASFTAVVRDGDEVVIVANAGQGFAQGPDSAARLLAQGLHLGARLPAFATSTGRVLLADLPPGELRQWLRGRQLPRLTAHTVDTPSRLAAILRGVRAEDACLASEEHELGVHAVAVALRDARGQAVAALNVVLPGGCQDGPRTLARWLPPLRAAARELRAML